MVRYIKGLVMVQVVAALAGCASQGALDSLHDDMDTAKSRIFTLEKSVGGIKDATRSDIAAVQKGVSSLENSIQGDVAAVRRISADIQASIDSAKSDMSALNGRIDDLSVAIGKPAEELKRYREDADKRIVTLEERILKLQTSLDTLTARLTEQLQQKQKAEQPSVTPESIYQKALDTYKSGSMAPAREQFAAFLEQNPKHDLAANAQYWVGETHYSEKNYEPAILAFQEVITAHPKSDKVPAAMLKQAMSFRAIKDGKSAVYVLKKLTEGYPKAEEAKVAKDLLKEIK